MSVNSISALGMPVQAAGVKNADAKLQAAIKQVLTSTQSTDVAQVGLASQLQAQTSGLKQLAGNLAQGLSLTQVADDGAEQIQLSLTQARDLAQQSAFPDTDDATRQQLNDQFTLTIGQIDRIAQGTTFNGVKLLDGSLSGDNALSLDTLLNPDVSGTGLSIASLTALSLLKGDLNIASISGAGQSLIVIGQALDQLGSTRADIGAFQSTLEFASASIDTALANQQAAQSTLSDSDLAGASSGQALADIQRNAAIALAAQGAHLNPALLRLVG